MASMGVGSPKLKKVRVVPNPEYPLGSSYTPTVPLPCCVSQGIHPSVSFLGSMRSWRGGTVVERGKVVGGGLRTYFQTRRLSSLTMWCVAASPKSAGISNTLSESPHRWIIESKSSLRCPIPLGPGLMNNYWRQGAGRVRRESPRSGWACWTLMERWIRLGEMKWGMNRRLVGWR